MVSEKYIDVKVSQAAQTTALATIDSKNLSVSVSSNWVIDAISAPIKGFFDAVLGTIVEIKAKIEAGDITGAIIAVLPIVAICLGIFVIIDLLTTKVLGFGLDLSGVKEALKKVLKVDLLISAIMGAWIGAGIKSPVEQIANKIFRPSILSVSASTQLRNRGKLTEPQWRDNLARWGVPDGHMKYLLDLADQKPAIGVAMRMYQFIDIPDQALLWLMTENDITMPQVQTLYLRYFHANRLRDEMSAYLGHLKTAYLDGVISEDQLEIELLTFKGSQEEIDKILADMSMEFQRRLTMTEYETRTWLYRKGVYGETEAEEMFYDQLALLGVNTAIVNATVRLEASKKGIDWEKA
ncbi:hypothetical protein MUP46_01155 [Patescibacteria group bacterium]|nr:hypothetical protein [Patescibacteria group bacterium]